jgi:hydroxypyruvate isomerase
MNSTKNNLNRRQFVTGAAISALAIASNSLNSIASTSKDTETKHSFNLKYAPHHGMFKAHAGEDRIDQIKFMADLGFTALEENGMMGLEVSLQEKIAAEMVRLGMTMGVFVAYAEFEKTSFATNDKDVRQMLINQMNKAVEVAKRVNAKWCTVVPGAFSTRLEWDYQTANVIENLKYCAEVCEPSGLVMVLEPLNSWTDHPGLFLTKIPQTYHICKAVDSPSCKILDDLYHQQITEGNLTPNIDMAWSEIAYFQVGDNPGRKEPTTGEINYRNIFKHLYEKGYTGIVGMEHGNSKPGKEGEMAVINAYQYCDNFK